MRKLFLAKPTTRIFIYICGTHENKKDMEEQNTTSKGEYRDEIVPMLKELNPDTEITDENYTSVLEQTLAEKLKPKIEQYDSANEELRAMMAGNPRLGKVLADMSKGAKFEEALPRYYDPTELVPQEGDPDYSVWEANKAKRLEDYQKQQALEAELEQNRINSEKAIDGWFNQREMSDDEKQEYGAFVKNTLDNAFKGAITPDLLDKMYYAMKYNSDVDQAKKIGVVQGKNAAIVEAEKIDDIKAAGDGLPSVDGTAVKKTAIIEPDNADPLVQGLRSMASRKSVLGGNY